MEKTLESEMERVWEEERNCVCLCHELGKAVDGIKRSKPICDECEHGEYYEGYPFGKDPNFYYDN